MTVVTQKRNCLSGVKKKGFLYREGNVWAANLKGKQGFIR